VEVKNFSLENSNFFEKKLSKKQPPDLQTVVGESYEILD
jgi:hypothetical protein